MIGTRASSARVEMSPVWAAPVSAVLGVPTVVRTKTWMAFDVRVSGVLTAALDRR